MPIYVWAFLHTNNVTALKYKTEIYCQSIKIFLSLKMSVMHLSSITIHKDMYACLQNVAIILWWTPRASPPCSQDSLLPICHLLINTEADSWVKWLLEKFSQCVCATQSECSKQAAGNIRCARGEVVLTCECVLCVRNYIPITTTAETTTSYLRGSTLTPYPGHQLFWGVMALLRCY